MLGENQMMEVLILDQGTEQYRSVSSPPMVSLWWAGTSHRKIRNNCQYSRSTGKYKLIKTNEQKSNICYYFTFSAEKKNATFSVSEVRPDFYLLLRCTGALQGSPRNLLGFKGAVGGSLFTAISHGRIGDVVQTSHTLGKENRTEEALVYCLWLS